MTWFRIGPEVPGGLGEEAELDTTVHPPLVQRLHIEFEGWLGDDLVEVFPCFLASERLAAAIVEAGLSGAAFDDVLVTIEPQLAAFEPDLVRSLPAWRWLRPIGTPFADDLWQDAQARLHASDRALEVLRAVRLQYADVDQVVPPS